MRGSGPSSNLSSRLGVQLKAQIAEEEARGFYRKPGVVRVMGGSIMSAKIMGIPLWVLLAGGAAAYFLVLKR